MDGIPPLPAGPVEPRARGRRARRTRGWATRAGLSIEYPKAAIRQDPTKTAMWDYRGDYANGDRGGTKSPGKCRGFNFTSCDNSVFRHECRDRPSGKVVEAHLEDMLSGDERFCVKVDRNEIRAGNAEKVTFLGRRKPDRVVFKLALAVPGY